MKYLLSVLLILSCFGCGGLSKGELVQTSPMGKTASTPLEDTQCSGDPQLPPALADKFEPVEDAALLQSALGKPKEGKLCQGQVYQSKEGTSVTLYRAWNSTNPNSQMGKWWAFERPKGKVAQYRSDYEICYQWSPLDKMTRCSLRPGVKVVVGTGQSAECSQYLTYPASPEKQVYIEGASSAVSGCTTYNDEFSWVAASVP